MNKLYQLQEILSHYNGALVAFSGGVDSSLLLRVAKDVLQDKVKAVTAVSPIFPHHELEMAKQVAAQIGVDHRIIATDPFKIPEFTANVPQRCYFCKKALFSQLQQMAADLGLEAVLDGTNADDTGDFRPGMRACRELGIQSPLLLAGLGKSDIRRLSAEYSLPTWDLPTYACLATRFPYGNVITPEGVQRVGAGEQFLKSLGFKQFRLRDHGDIARLEVYCDQFPLMLEQRTVIIQKLKELGYTYISLDLEGYRSGSLNDTITVSPRQKNHTSR